MRRATRWTTLALAIAAFSHAAALADEAKLEGDLKKMQGTWVKAGGDGPDSTWSFEGDTLKATVDGSEYKCKVKLDPKAQPHPSVDIHVEEGPGDAAGAKAKAIYKFEGERLLLCVSMPNRDARPTEFVTTPDEAYFFELKKED